MNVADYYDDYYNGDFTDFEATKQSSKNHHLPNQQMPNSANDFLQNSSKKQLLKRYGESDSHRSSDWAIPHPATEEELRDRMKYDPYYAQYYYSKYRPQEEGRDAEDDIYEDNISKKIRNVRDNHSIFR